MPSAAEIKALFENVGSRKSSISLTAKRINRVLSLNKKLQMSLIMHEISLFTLSPIWKPIERVQMTPQLATFVVAIVKPTAPGPHPLHPTQPNSTQLHWLQTL